MTTKYKIMGLCGYGNLPVILTNVPVEKPNSVRAFRFADEPTIKQFPQFMNPLIFSKEEAQSILNFNENEDAPLEKVNNLDKWQWRKCILMGITDLKMVEVTNEV